MRDDFNEHLKTSMKTGDAGRTSALRMILARIKEADIAARPKAECIPDAEIPGVLRGMVKSRREAAELYRRGGRVELASREEDEITVIESFLPPQMDDDAMRTAVTEAVLSTGASGIKDMGKVMAALRSKHAAAIDMSRAGLVVKEILTA